MNRHKISRTVASALFFAIAAATQPTAAQDAKRLVLRVADHLPQGHSIQRYGVKPWMEQVTKATGGEVQFEYYPGEQLGKAKDLLSLVQSGVADLVLFVPSYASDKMPLTAALELPGMFASSCQAIFTHMKLAKEGAILAQREYASNGVRVLFATALPPYQLLSAKRKIDSPRDIEGMKLRVAGGAMDLTVRKLKGVGVKMAAPELFEAITRGTIDGAILSYGTPMNYKLPVKYATVGEGFGTAAPIFIVRESRWQQFPEHVKKAMLEAGEEASRSVCAGMDKQEAADFEKLQQQGATAVRWSAADKKEMDAVLMSVANEWATELDKRGKPGSEVLKALLEARGSR